MVDQNEPIYRALIYILGATAYAVSGYLTKVQKYDHISFDPVRFGTTVLIGVIAGGIMASRGSEMNPEAYAAAAAIAIPIADKVLNLVFDTFGGTAPGVPDEPPGPK